MPPSSFDNLLAVRRSGHGAGPGRSEAESQSDGRFSGQERSLGPGGPIADPSIATYFQGDRAEARHSRKSPSDFYRSGPMCSRSLRNRQAPRLRPVCRVVLMHRGLDRRTYGRCELHSGRLGLRSDSNDRVRPTFSLYAVKSRNKFPGFGAVSSMLVELARPTARQRGPTARRPRKLD